MKTNFIYRNKGKDFRNDVEFNYKYDSNDVYIYFNDDITGTDFKIGANDKDKMNEITERNAVFFIDINIL